MDFALSDEQRLLIDTVRRFVRAELAPLEDEVEASGTLAPDKAAAIHAKAKPLGLYGMNIAQENGGGGLSGIGDRQSTGVMPGLPRKRAVVRLQAVRVAQEPAPVRASTRLHRLCQAAALVEVPTVHQA